MSRRDEIIALIDTRLKAIQSGPGGYQTDAGNNVNAWLDYQLEPDRLPALIYKDESRSVSMDGKYTPSIGDEVHILDVTIEGITEIDQDGIQKLRDLLADIRQAIATDDLWSGKAIATDAWSDEIAVEETELGLLGFCMVSFQIVYRLPFWTD